MESPILLYDGTCGLCDRVVQFVLRHDRNDVFRFAPLQSDFAASILLRHSCDRGRLSTMALVFDPFLPAERLLIRSEAALAVLEKLGFPWRALAALGRLCPRALRDRLYDWIARHRYKVFRRQESCLIPAPAHREKFLG